jgi:8-oxo-dGTP diphosphatase
MNAHKTFVKYPTGKIKKNNFCFECGRYNNRYISCDTLVIDNNKVLMILRKKDPESGKWCLPGGYLSWDETVEECAAREVKEETGYIIKDLKFLKINSNPNREERQNIVLFFKANIKEKKDPIDLDEVIKIKWFSLDELPNDIVFGHDKIIKEHFAKN